MVEHGSGGQPRHWAVLAAVVAWCGFYLSALVGPGAGADAAAAVILCVGLVVLLIQFRAISALATAAGISARDCTWVQAMSIVLVWPAAISIVNDVSLVYISSIRPAGAGPLWMAGPYGWVIVALGVGVWCGVLAAAHIAWTRASRRKLAAGAEPEPDKLPPEDWFSSAATGVRLSLLVGLYAAVATVLHLGRLPDMVQGPDAGGSGWAWLVLMIDAGLLALGASGLSMLASYVRASPGEERARRWAHMLWPGGGVGAIVGLVAAAACAAFGGGGPWSVAATLAFLAAASYAAWAGFALWDAVGPESLQE